MTLHEWTTEQQAKVTIAVAAQAGTSTAIAKRAGVIGRTTRKVLVRLMDQGVVARVYTHPPQYRFCGTQLVVRAAQEALADIESLEVARGGDGQAEGGLVP
jgi:transcription initiation factor IIE alpha subunit